MELRILYFHGLGGRPEPARPFLRTVAERLPDAEVVVRSPDQRRLEAPSESSGAVEEYARQFLDAHAPPDARRLLLVGHSVGALLAVAAARQRNGCEGICLVEPAWFDEVADPFRPYLEPGGNGIEGLVRTFRERDGLDDDERAYLASLRQTPPSVFEALGTAMVEDADVYAERARMLDAPKLCVSGGESLGERVMSWASDGPDPRTTSIVIEGVGHSPHRARPERVADRLAEWFDRVQGAEPSGEEGR